MKRLSLVRFVMGALVIWACSGGGDGGSPTEPTQPTVNPPTVQNIEITTAEDTSASFVFVGSDATGAAVTFSIVDNPVNGSITLNGNGGIYNPNANYYGGDTFSYKATSVNGVSNTATATISITSVNDTPNTSDASATTDEDTTVEITLSATDIENDDLTFNVKNNPSNGTVSISANIATYTPNQDWNGTDTFNFEAVDSNNRTILNTATATIVVNPVNDAPVANNMTVSTDENRFSQLSITLDASDVDNDNLTYSIASDVSNGETSLNGNIVTYTPSQDWNGEDVFTFLVNDGTVDSNTATITITVNAVNDAPETVNQTVSTNEDEPISITLTATDIDSDTFSYSLESNTSNGTINLSNDVATYTPTTNWNGTDTFTFNANDGTDDSNTSTVTITVDAVNDVPVANDVTVSMNENKLSGLYQPVTITLDATDVEGDDLTYSIVDTPSNGTLGSITNNQIIYTPTQDWNGEDTFTYKANDGTADSNTATVVVTVSAVNDAPVANDSSVTTNEDTAIVITLTATDVENDNLTFTIVSDVSNGITTRSGATVTYTPNNNWNGTDTFTFNANDGTDDSNTSTVTITVDAVNDAPVIEDTNLSTFLNYSSGSSIELSATDIDGDSSFTYSIVDDPTKGTATISGSTLTYVPNNNYAGLDSLTYKANDGQLDSEQKTVDFIISAHGETSVEFRKDISNGINNSWVESAWGNFEFDDRNDYHAVFSTSLWIKVPDIEMNGAIIARYDEDYPWSINFKNNNSSKIVFEKHADGSTNEMDITINYDEWNHVVFIVDIDGYRFHDFPRLIVYVNGSYVNTINLSRFGGSLHHMIDLTFGNLILGLNRSNGNSRQFIGEIDNLVIINNHILSESQARDLYNNGAGISDLAGYLGAYESDIISLFKLNEGSGTSIDDESSNNFTTTLNGGATWSIID